MGWDGAGNVNRTNGVFTGTILWQDSRDASRKIRADDHDTHDQDIADAIERTHNLDGENAAAANMPMGGFRHTGVGNATARDQYSSVDSLQDGDHTFAVDTGAADVYAMALSPAITAYVNGMRVAFESTNTNTGASTLNINTVGAKSILRNDGQELLAGDIVTGRSYVLIYEDTADAFYLVSPPKSILPRGWIDGLTLSNAADADHDITTAVGVARDDGNDVDLELGSILVKQLDDPWSVGTNQGGNNQAQIDGVVQVTFNDNGGSPDDVTSASTWTVTPSVGDTLIVTGSASNDGTYQITAATSSVINVATGSFVSEVNSDAVINTIKIDTDYAKWLIMRPDTGVVDQIFDESFTAPSLPTNYTKKVLIGGIRTDGSANIIADHFMQVVPGGRTFQSGAQTISSAGLLTIPHMLGAEPDDVRLTLENTSAEHNFSVGDRIVGSEVSTTAATNAFSAITKDTTNISIRMSSSANVFVTGNKTSGALAALTNGSWDLYISADTQ